MKISLIGEGENETLVVFQHVLSPDVTTRCGNYCRIHVFFSGLVNVIMENVAVNLRAFSKIYNNMECFTPTAEHYEV